MISFNLSMKNKISNCLIEAIKAKIKSPKNVKIRLVKGRTAEKKKRLHFMWSDGVFDFEFVPIKRIYLPLIFRGKIKKHALGTIQRFKDLCKYKDNREIEE